MGNYEMQFLPPVTQLLLKMQCPVAKIQEVLYKLI